jgi:hypothetical protein
MEHQKDEGDVKEGYCQFFHFQRHDFYESQGDLISDGSPSKKFQFMVRWCALSYAFPQKYCDSKG